MLQRILDQGLQHKPRDERSVSVRRDLDIDGETIVEADTHYVEICIEQSEFFAERELRLVTVVERAAKQISEPGEHGVRRLDVAMHERRNGVQGVEQKMGLKLRGQRFQAGGGETRFQPCCPGRVLDRPAIELDRVYDGQHRAEGHDLGDEASDQDPPEDNRAIVGDKVLHECDIEEILDRYARDDDQDLRPDCPPSMPIDWRCPHEPEEQRSEDRARVPVGEAINKDRLPGNRPVVPQEVQRRLQRRQQAERRPDDESEEPGLPPAFI